MKVLWLSMNPALYGVIGGNMTYNGGGWISSLQKLLYKVESVDLGILFLTDKPLPKKDDGNFHYYPIFEKPLSAFKKLKRYYGGYKREVTNHYSKVQKVIDEFQPDIIHLFGIENELADLLGKTSIPVIVHLQGMLGPCNNAFFPVGFNNSSFVWPPSISESIFRNGYIFAKNSIVVRSRLEEQNFKNVKYCMGRTAWDRMVSSMLSFDSVYFHIDEVLRDEFYDNAGRWAKKGDGFVITSTISDTVYKGLDVILKTASLLKRISNITIEWRVIGIEPDCPLVSHIENILKIISADVDVRYLGIKSPQELCDLLLKSTLYVHPSYIDNSPNALCEAQILGVPVIACNVGGVGSIVKDGSTGILVPSNGVYEMAFYILKLYNDAGLLSLIGHGGYEAAIARHNKEKIKADLLNAYKSIVDN